MCARRFNKETAKECRSNTRKVSGKTKTGGQSNAVSHCTDVNAANGGKDQCRSNGRFPGGSLMPGRARLKTTRRERSPIRVSAS
ncbi:MAG: hypothetical protein ACLULK_05625, partial [Anaerovoracaceae bacterium]